MKHTKGEWKVERVPIQSKGGSNTCFKIGPFQACIYDDWRQYVERGITTAEIEANARLIAAAPELLEACMNLENDDNSIPEHAWKLIQDAIKKATS